MLIYSTAVKVPLHPAVEFFFIRQGHVSQLSPAVE